MAKFNPKFKEGDQVIVKHQRELGVMTVDNSCRETDITRVVTNEPVGYYVVISNDKKSNQAYHEENLEHYVEKSENF